MTIAFDFDGVIHKYRKGWQNGEIYDNINRNILQLIKDLLDEGHIVFILSSRSRFQIKRFFKHHKSIIPFEFETFSILKKFWTKKGVCGICNHKAVFDVIIDDRALNFNPINGIFKERILSFKPAVYPKENEKRYTFSVGDYIEWEYFHEHSADKSLYGKTFTASIISIDYEYDQYHILAEYGYDYIPFELARKSRFQLAYAQYWDMVKDIIDEEGWVYTKEAPHMLDAYFEGKTGKLIEFQKSFGKSGDNPHWLTRGSRWRPSELS